MTTEPTTALRMKDAVIGMLVTVNDETAHNPGGYGRITARSPKHGKVHVDSGEFPGEEVTGWYSVEDVAPYILPPAPTEPTTTECVICYHVGPCTDDGEALICTDRAACRARCDAVVDRLYSEFYAQAQPPAMDEAIYERAPEHDKYTGAHAWRDRMSGQVSYHFIGNDPNITPFDAPPPAATMDEVVEAAYARRNIPLEGEERYTHGAAYARERATATEEPNADVNWSEGPAMEAT